MRQIKNSSGLTSVSVAVACVLMAAGMARAETPDAGVRVAQATTSFNLPSQPLADSLRAVAGQTNSNILFDREKVAGITARPLQAELSVQEALAELLRGTDLVSRSVDGKTVMVVSKDAGATTGVLRKLSGIRLAEADTGSSEAKAEESEARLEEIVVTAQKREQRLQDVPVSISVVTSDEINRRGLVGASDYLRGMPGVNQVEGVTGQSIAVRGIEVNTIFQTFRGGETTGTYFGETPTVGVAGSTGSNVDIKLVDIERVEVLRGPQGTAFGSASMGGTVRTIPVAPKLNRLEGVLTAGYSATSGTGGNNNTFQAVANIPVISDKLAIRGTAYTFSDSGYYRNRAGSDPAFQALATAFGAEAFATDEDDVGAYNVQGARVSALFQANDDLRFTLSYLTQKNETDGTPVATNGPFEQAIFRVPLESTSRGQTGGVLDQSIDIANAVMEYGFGWADLLATYSYVRGGTIYTRPYTSIGVNLAAVNPNDSDYRGHLGEVRLVTKLDGPWNFIGGVSADTSDSDNISDGYWFGSPATNPFGVRHFLHGLEQRDQKQKAAFGEASWEVLTGLTLTGGVRAFDYERSSRVAIGTSPVVLRDADGSGTTFRANLGYKPNADALIYAGWSQGFRIGGPQAGLTPSLCDPDGDGVVDGTDVTIESTRRINSDEVDSYEIGGKFSALGRRLAVDVAIYRMNWDGLPVSQTIGSPAVPLCTSGFTVNAGTAKSDGIELQTKFQATESVRIDLGGSYTNARLTEGVPAQGFSDGARLPGTPKVNANLGLQYGFGIAGREAFVRADAIYIGPFFGNLLEAPVTKSGDYVKLDATARVSFSNLNLDLYVRNVTNEDAFTFRGAYNFATLGEFYGYRLRPRTVGFQASYAF